jgi:hypothetical protein
MTTWLLVIAVVVLGVQDRKKAAAIKELQKQRRWVVDAKDEWAGYREMMEVHDGERERLHQRMNWMEKKLGVEWEGEDAEDSGPTVGLHNEY